MSTANEPPASPSILERLKGRLGPERVPRITLDAGAGDAAQPDSPPSVLKRLESRLTPSTRFRVEGEIARGGMGAILQIWDEDLRRTMAMKVALGGAGGRAPSLTEEVDPRVLARLLEEAQVTGQLDHPGIVPVHELGLDETGRVYFTMRLVRGRDLEHVFALVRTGAEGWSVTRALGVLLKACEALAYAHDKGVVHRDLKPANLMVGRFGEVYVMDWGLARVRGERERHDLRVAADPGALAGREQPLAVDRREDASGQGNEELYTMDGDVLGTPAYMAPEQARGELERIDARSDVYSMGAMLYALLGGSAPYGPRGAFAVLQELLAGPPRPLEELAPAAPAELVAIAAKAMAREPAQRYPDMLALAEDLRAFLEGRVVSAFETGALAEARKWVRRNRPLAAALAAGVLALVAGLVTSVVLKRRADASALLAEERRGEAVEAATRADASAREAARQASIASEVNAFLNRDLLAAVAPEEMGIDVSVREVLDAASSSLEGRFPAEPLVEAELRLTIGTTYGRLGEYARGEQHLARANELFQAALGPRAAKTLEARQALAETLDDRGQPATAKALTLETLALLRAEFGPEHPAALACMSALSLYHLHLGELQQARALREETLAVQRRVLGPDHEDTLASLNNLGVSYRVMGLPALAEATLSEAVAARRRVSGDRHPETLIAISNLALACDDAGDSARAQALQTEVVQAFEQVFGATHPKTARAQVVLATLYLLAGRTTEGEPIVRQAHEVLLAALGPDHPEVQEAGNSLATALQDLGRMEEALQLRLELMERQRRTVGPRHPFSLVLASNLAGLYFALGRNAEAIALYEEVAALSRELRGPANPETLVVLENLAGCYRDAGRLDECRTLLDEVLAGRRAALGPTHPDVGKTLYNLAMLERPRDPLRAQTHLEEALAVFRAAKTEAQPIVSDGWRMLGDMRRVRDDQAGAAQAYAESLALRRRLGPDDPLSASLLQRIAEARLQLADPAGALEPLEEALALRRALLPARDRETLTTLQLCARTLTTLADFERAEELAIELHETLSAGSGPPHPMLPEACATLRDLYEAWGKPDLAEEWAAAERGE